MDPPLKLLRGNFRSKKNRIQTKKTIANTWRLPWWSILRVRGLLAAWGLAAGRLLLGGLLAGWCLLGLVGDACWLLLLVGACWGLLVLLAGCCCLVAGLLLAGCCRCCQKWRRLWRENGFCVFLEERDSLRRLRVEAYEKLCA